MNRRVSTACISVPLSEIANSNGTVPSPSGASVTFDYDDAGRLAERPRQVGDRGCRHRADEASADAPGGEPRLQGRLEHVTGDPRVLADDHAAASAPPDVPRKDAATGPAEFQHLVGGDRRFADESADTVGAEVAWFHAA